MLTRLICLAALVLLLAGTCLSQTPTNQDHDVIVLKNGGVARGRILTAVEGKHLVLEVASGKTIRIQLNDIDFITNNLAYTPPETQLQKESRTLSEFVSGPRVLSHAIILSGEHSTNYSMDLQLGGFIERNVMLAAGVRFDRYAFNLLSVRLHTYLFTTSRQVSTETASLFVHLGLGYGQVVRGTEPGSSAGGANFSIGAGIMVPTALGPAFQMELGLHHQSISLDNRTSAEGNFAQFSLGLCF